MKKSISLFLMLILLLCGCSQGDSHNEATTFTQRNDGILVSNTGVEYEFLAMEWDLHYFGEPVYLGPVQGEEEYLYHLIGSFKTGLYTIKEAENDDILIRTQPRNEWTSIYRKATLPELDLSLDNCTRLEFVTSQKYTSPDRHAEHVTCNVGITDKAEITAFLSDLRSQPSPEDAECYDMIRKPDGSLQNCYVCGVIYAFFDEAPYITIQMYVTSYNDLAYSVQIGDSKYVLPDELREKLQSH